MRKRARSGSPLAVAAIVLLLATTGCQTGAPGDQRAERVVMISYDGVGADLAWQWIERGTASDPEGLQGMVAHGLAAGRLRMVDPTLTSVNHITLATGLTPSATGIVSNTYRPAGKLVTERAVGFLAPFAGEALWTAARRQGIRVGALMWVGADGRGYERMADFGVVWPGYSLTSSAVEDLDPDNAASTGEVPSHDGAKALLWRVPVNLREAEPHEIELLVAAVDATPDGRPRYDTVAVRRTDEISWQYASEREWFDVEVAATADRDLRQRTYVAWCKALRLDRFRGRIRLYRGAMHRLIAYPDAFEDRLSEAVGPWPGVPDEAMVAAWWLDAGQGIDLDTFIEQAERLVSYIDRIVLHVLEHEEWRLLLGYHPTPDQYQHANYIVRRDQWAYSPGREIAAREGLKRLGRSVDASIATLWRALDPTRDVLVAVSDHGHLPIFQLVNLNRVLADAGLVKLEEDRGEPRVASDTPMVGIGEGACGHVYLNLRGREPNGVVAGEETEGLLQRAARALADVNFEGQPVVERVLSRAEAATRGLDHANGGDLVVFLNPGFAFSKAVTGPATEPSRSYAQHGYLSDHDGMCGMLFARGAGLRRSRPREVHATAVAGMVAAWLGLEPVPPL